MKNRFIKVNRLHNPLRSRQAGAIVVMFALMLPILIGFLALAVDIGNQYAYRQGMQHAADSAALAGAYAVASDPTADPEKSAQLDAKNNNFEHGANGIEVLVARSPTGYLDENGKEKYASDPTAVGVTIQQPRDTFFSQVLTGSTSNTVRARAVASLGKGGDGTLLVLKPSGQSLDLGGNATVTATSNVLVNSVSSNGISVDAGQIVAGGIAIAADSSTCGEAKCMIFDKEGNPVTCDGGCVVPGMPRLVDPFFSRPEAPTEAVNLQPPAIPAAVSCDTSTKTCPPGRYDTRIKIDSSGWKFQEGLYYLMKGLEVTDKATLTGTGVMIYNACDLKNGDPNTCVPDTGGSIEFAKNGTIVDLTSGYGGTNSPYFNVVIFQSRTNTNSMTIKNSAKAILNGIVYITKDTTRTISDYTTPDYALDLQTPGAIDGGSNAIFVLWSAKLQAGVQLTLTANFGKNNPQFPTVSLAE